MVIFCAVGGRMSILGAAYGTLLVNVAKMGLSESFPQLWQLAMGGLFIGVVVAFPSGLAGLYDQHVKPWITARLAARRPVPTVPASSTISK